VLQISDRALAIIDRVRVVSGAADGEAIVLFRQDGGVGFAVRAPVAGDHLIARDGQAVVIVAEDLVGPFDGWLLDFEPTTNRGAFTLRRP
jgi:hypothetical protein